MYDLSQNHELYKILKESKMTSKKKYLYAFVSAIYFLSFGAKLFAQTTQQIITLTPGWNSVFLELNPQNNNCNEIFENLPIASVWAWNPKTTAVEYIKNPDELIPEHPQWLTWYPPDKPYSYKTNLFSLLGEHAYLIQIEGNQTIELSLTGRPCLPNINWKPDSVNLVGFHVIPDQGPFFSDFFSPSSAHGNDNPEIYYLNENSIWEKIQNTKATRINKGTAYWIHCEGESNYVGPVKIEVMQGNGLDYGDTQVEQSIKIQNVSEKVSELSLEILKSTKESADIKIPFSRWSPLPSGSAAWSEGSDTTTVKRSSVKSESKDVLISAGWKNFNEIMSQTYEQGESKTIRLAVRRASLKTPGHYESMLQILTDSGLKILIPATLINKTDKSGLWEGTVEINKVNNPINFDQPDKPVPTASELTFRIIIHVDINGKVKLLKEVIQMWDKGEDNDEEGKFVLITNVKKLSKYTGVALRDGRFFGRRISSSVFSFPEPLLMEGTFLSGNTLSCFLVTSATDPLNPFKHKYNPDHTTGYDIKRIITLELTDTDPTNLDLSLAGWGDKDMGGKYFEEIHGLHKNVLYVEGIFRVHKVSDIGELIE